MQLLHIQINKQDALKTPSFSASWPDRPPATHCCSAQTQVSCQPEGGGGWNDGGGVKSPTEMVHIWGLKVRMRHRARGVNHDTGEVTHTEVRHAWRGMFHQRKNIQRRNVSCQH